MSEEKNEIAGWVAWSDTSGVMVQSLHLSGGQQVRDPRSESLIKACDAIGMRARSEYKLSLEGWHIRPCKVVFTDEDKVKLLPTTCLQEVPCQFCGKLFQLQMSQGERDE